MSLHSPYFRTIFQYTWFLESDQNITELTHIKPDLLEAVVAVKECTVELLEVASIIPLEDHQLVD